jgi:signal transduction histidine kinase/ligand-binding sensor domain-containing protein
MFVYLVNISNLLPSAFRRTVLFWALLVCHAPLAGNNPVESLYFDNLTREYGLVQSNIQTISVDPKGYVWLGSSDGLYKWDGLILIIFQNDKKDSLSLNNNNISALSQTCDSSGLWIGTVFGGLNFLDYQTADFHSWLPINRDKEGERYLNNIKSICEVNDSTLLLGTLTQGLLKVQLTEQRKAKSFERISTSKGEKNFTVFSCQRIGSQIFTGTSRGLFLFDNNGNLIKQFPFFSNGTIQDQWVKDFAQLRSGKILIATQNALWEWSKSEMTPLPFQTIPGASQITELTVDHTGSIWIGSLGKGLFTTDSLGRNPRNYTASEKNGGLINNQINDLMFYGHQPILFAATPAGVSSLDFEKHIFKSYDLRKLSDAQNTSIYFLMQDSQKDFWFWSFDGLYTQNEPQEKFSRILSTDYGKKQNMVKDGIELNNKIWMATSNGLLESDLSGKNMQWHKFSADSLPDGRINDLSSISRGKGNNLWLTSQAGIIVFNPDDQSYKVHPFPLNDWEEEYIPVTDMVFTHNHTKGWIGTKSEFLIHFNTKDNSFQKIPAVLERPGSQSPPRSNYVLSMATQNDDYLWLATFGSGLLRFDTKTHKLSDEFAVKTLTTNTYAVCADREENLWISTDYGITRLNPENKEFHEFGLDEGTFCQEFNERAVFVTQEGEIMMGGIDGFVFFNPQNIQLNDYVPPVYISSYFIGNPNSSVGGESALDVTEITSKSIEVDYDREALSFEVSVLNFSHPENNMIAWKLEGFDNEWSEAPALHIISYAYLPPGKYRLKVKGANNHGLWNEEGDYLDIIVNAPFYHKPWFSWVFGLAVVLLIFLVFIMRMRLLNRQKVILSTMVREKTRHLQKAIHELKESQRQVMLQNQELEIHRHDLKDLVARRTADLEKAKIKAEESDRLKTAFLANLSHEIRTPMNAIVGFSTLLSNMEMSDEDKSEFIFMIQQSGDNLLALINDIIDISRIETGQMSLHPSLIEIAAFLNNIIKTLEFQPKKNSQVELILDIPESLQDVSIYSDEHRLRQVIINLIGNALKFTSEGYVKLSVEKFSRKDLRSFIPELEVQDLPHRALVFIVEDTGIGIPEHEQKNIFQPFRKIENSGEALYGGMGLGLSIVKSILPPLGGDIYLRSYPGQGTTFYFYIPYDTKGK